MPRMYGSTIKNITQPGDNNELIVTLNQPAINQIATGEPGCVCSIDGLFWENPESSGSFNLTEIEHEFGGGGGGGGGGG